MPHHVSKVRSQMPLIDRAAQFSPFAALTGYEDAITETARLTNAKAELDENALEQLDKRMGILLESKSEHPEITVLYFVADKEKAGGEYVSLTGKFKKADLYNQLLVLCDGTQIPISDIYSLDSEIFPNY